jgi:hypothetical protein
VKTHQHIGERSLAMAQAIVDAIDRDPRRCGLTRARAVCERWRRQRPNLAVREWLAILQLPWEEIRAVLLERSEHGQRLRQTDPFCGVWTPSERWRIYREHRDKV